MSSPQKSSQKHFPPFGPFRIWPSQTMQRLRFGVSTRSLQASSIWMMSDHFPGVVMTGGGYQRCYCRSRCKRRVPLKSTTKQQKYHEHKCILKLKRQHLKYEKKSENEAVREKFTDFFPLPSFSVIFYVKCFIFSGWIFSGSF